MSFLWATQYFQPTIVLSCNSIQTRPFVIERGLSDHEPELRANQTEHPRTAVSKVQKSMSNLMHFYG